MNTGNTRKVIFTNQNLPKELPKEAQDTKERIQDAQQPSDDINR